MCEGGGARITDTAHPLESLLHSVLNRVKGIAEVIGGIRKERETRGVVSS
jgi:hypothetical protein